MKRITIFLLLTGIIACKPVNNPSEDQDDLFMATLYNYFAAEYQALAHQAYNIATERILEIRETKPDRNDLAIVLDIDETILDNSPYQASLILKNTSYDSCWNEWCNHASARDIPGVKEFLVLADSLGMNIFYISNRKDATVKEGTIENMISQGFPQTGDEHFLLRTGESSKEARRMKVEEKYEIVMLCGDNLGDFYEDSDDPDMRSRIVQEKRQEFGKKFIVLPNAMYGNWVTSLGNTTDPARREELLKIITGDGWCK